jgi:hypothetical protein
MPSPKYREQSHHDVTPPGRRRFHRGWHLWRIRGGSDIRRVRQVERASKGHAVKRTVATTTAAVCLALSGATAANAYTYVENQAIGSATDYLRMDGFSKSGLIDQVKYEGFSTTNATLGATVAARRMAKQKGITVIFFWKREAYQSAKSYAEFAHFSRSGMIEQLEYEGFTHKQAVYGAEHVGY